MKYKSHLDLIFHTTSFLALEGVDRKYGKSLKIVNLSGNNFAMIKVIILALFVPALLAAQFQRETKIIGGQVAREGQFPYQVALLKWKQMYCGGSIIAASVVLTAAHCEIDDLKNFIIFAGGNNYKRLEEGQVRNLAQRIAHEKYTEVGNGFDIALIKVKRPFNFTGLVKPIALSTSGNEPTTVLASGWGLTRDGDPNSIPDNLQYVTMGYLSRNDCLNYWDRLPANVVCATAPGKDTCQGKNFLSFYA